jgi:hypothetical protein
VNVRKTELALEFTNLLLVQGFKGGFHLMCSVASFPSWSGRGADSQAEGGKQGARSMASGFELATLFFRFSSIPRISHTGSRVALMPCTLRV